MLKQNHIQPVDFVSAIAIKDVDLSQMIVPIPFLDTKEVTVMISMPGAISSAAMDQTAGTFRNEVVELYGLPEIDYKIGRHDEKNEFFTSFELENVVVAIHPKFKEGEYAEKSNAYYALGTLDILFGAGSDFAPFQMQSGDGKLDPEVQEAFGRIKSARFTADRLHEVHTMTVAEARALAKKHAEEAKVGEVPDVVWPHDLDSEIKDENDLVLVSYKDDGIAKRGVETVLNTFAREVFAQAAQNIQNFHAKYPTEMISMLTDETTDGHDEEVMQSVLESAKLYAYTKGLTGVPEEMVNLIHLAYADEDTIDSAKGAVGALFEALDVEADRKELEASAFKLMSLIDERTAREARNPIMTERYGKYYTLMLNEILDSLPKIARQFYDDVFKESLEENLDMLMASRAMQKLGLKGVLEHFHQTSGQLFEEAEMTPRQFDESLEDKPELKELLSDLQKQFGDENVHVEARVIRPKNDNQ